MNPEFLFRFLLWSLAVNYAILLTWFLGFMLLRDRMHGLHQRWFRVPDSTLDAIHYSGIVAYKCAILFFNFVPLVALWMLRSEG